MKIDTIMKRVEGKEKEIVKLEKKLDRIEKAASTGWEVNPYFYDEHDLKYTRQDLDSAREKLKDLKAMLKTETEKANSRNVKAVLDFLEMWKEQVRKYYADSFEKYLEAYEESLVKDHEYCNWWNKGNGYADPNRREIRKAYREYCEEFRKRWAFITAYAQGKSFDTERFESDLKVEAERKYDSIIERTNEITGTITDATGLEIGASGELDGYVIGERGKAHVHTIGAGGYNIQCYHFRVLVHEVR